MERIYLYKIVTDDGYAPCVQDGLLSLAICKPMIRSTAKDGDWIIAVSTNGLAASNHVVYAARVTKKLAAGEYYRDPTYANRRDRIYRWTGSELRQVPNSPVHANEREVAKDIGQAPGYRRAAAILSNEFLYFGANAAVTPDPSSPLGQVIRRLGQGHRVNHAYQVERQLIQLLNTAWARKSLQQHVVAVGTASIPCGSGADCSESAGGCDGSRPRRAPMAGSAAGPVKRRC